MFLMPDNKWARLLAYVTGLVNQKFLLQNEYLIAENRILRAHLPTRMSLSDPERSTFAEIGERLGRTALQKIACAAKPDTILAWYRRLLAVSTKHPTAEWMIQMARNATDEGSGYLRGMRYLLHDRDAKFCAAFLDVLRSKAEYGRWPFHPVARI